MKRKSILKISLLILIILSPIILASCASTVGKQGLQQIDHISMPVKNGQIESFEASMDFKIKFNDQDMSASGHVQIAKKDSLNMKIFGPFGILLGRLYSDADNFVYYNVYQNQVFTGKPSADTLGALIFMPLSFHDIVSFMKTHFSLKPEKYIYTRMAHDSVAVFEYDSGKDYIEEVYLDKYHHCPKKIIRRHKKSGRVLLLIKYMFIQNHDGYDIAEKIKIEAPFKRIELNLSLGDIKINQGFSSAFRFKVPEQQ